MSAPDSVMRVEEQIDLWRTYLRRRQAIHTADAEELEDHLRAQIAALGDVGLSEDEAFLVAVKRIGALDPLSREFAREHSERLWKQLVTTPDDTAERGTRSRSEAVIAFALAVLAALAIKAPELFGIRMDENPSFYARNASLFVLPLLTGYFLWKRGLQPITLLKLAAAFVAAAIVVNAFAFSPGGATEVLTAIHLPIALWLTVGIAYAGARSREVGGRMDFVRFSGELFIYYVLMALGGGLLVAFMVVMFQTIGIDPEPFVERWMLPCGAVGAVLVGAWLVEAKQSVIENMAPVLTRLFTPLFALVLLTFLATLASSGRGLEFQRDLMIAFDVLLVIVAALLLYSISARDPSKPADAFDVLQVVLVISALLVDAVALWTIVARISELGFTANRVAALGVNIILFVNLLWSAVLYVRFLRSRGTFAALERWQTTYLPVYSAWAAIVVLVFPPLFGYA